MKIWQKLLIVCITGALVYGLGFCGTVWANLAQGFNLLSAGVAMLGGGIVGWIPSK